MQQSSGFVFDPDTIDLIPVFLAARLRDAELIEQELASLPCNYGSVARIAHAIRGSGGSYGFPSISELGTTIEQAAREGRYIVVLEKLAQMRRIVDEIARALEQATAPRAESCAL
jgi:HPt (histidine-containing phosphotransfer) domain-containing protein